MICSRSILTWRAREPACPESPPQGVGLLFPLVGVTQTWFSISNEDKSENNCFCANKTPSHQISQKLCARCVLLTEIWVHNWSERVPRVHLNINLQQVHNHKAAWRLIAIATFHASLSYARFVLFIEMQSTQWQPKEQIMEYSWCCCGWTKSRVGLEHGAHNQQVHTALYIVH